MNACIRESYITAPSSTCDGIPADLDEINSQQRLSRLSPEILAYPLVTDSEERAVHFSLRSAETIERPEEEPEDRDIVLDLNVDGGSYVPEISGAVVNRSY